MHPLECRLGLVPVVSWGLVFNRLWLSRKKDPNLSSFNRPLTILIYSNGKQLQYQHFHHSPTQPFDAVVFPFVYDYGTVGSCVDCELALTSVFCSFASCLQQASFLRFSGVAPGSWVPLGVTSLWLA